MTKPVYVLDNLDRIWEIGEYGHYSYGDIRREEYTLGVLEEKYGPLHEISRGKLIEVFKPASKGSTVVIDINDYSVFSAKVESYDEEVNCYTLTVVVPASMVSKEDVQW